MELGLVFAENVYYTISLLVPVLIFAIRTEHRSHLPWRLAGSFLVLVLLGFIPSAILYGVGRSYLVSANIDMAINFLLNLVYCVILCRFCFKETLLCSLFVSTAGYCLQHIWGRLIDYSLFQSLPHDNFGWDCLQYFLGLLCLGGMCFLVYFFVVRKMHPIEGDFAENRNGQLILSLCVIGVSNFFSAYALQIVSHMTEEYQSIPEMLFFGGQLNLFINVSAALTAFLALFCLLGMYRSKTISSEKDELDRMIQEQKKKFESEQNNINLINIKCHDLKHQLAAIEGKLSREQINETVQAVNIYDSTIHTGNEALDIVFASRQSILKQKGISLSVLLDGSLLSYIPSYELYSIFGNAIDNAIEGVSSLPEEKRRIHITQQHKGAFLSVQIRNYYSGTIAFKDGLPQTKKDDESYHGFGIKSMKLIMEKYQGHLSIETDKDVFLLSLLFFLPPSK